MKRVAFTIFCALYTPLALAQTTANSTAQQQPQTTSPVAPTSAPKAPTAPAPAPTTVSDAESEPNAGAIRIITRPEILGQWGMQIPNNQQCVEYYNFRGNNEVVIKSDQEWSLGQYQYQVPNNRSEQLPALIFHIKYDNNEKDCSGVQEDQTGEIQQFFVKWVTPRQIQFCGNDKGENCFATLNKQFP